MQMLDLIELAPKPLDPYRPLIGGEAIERLHALAAPLRGLRVAQINATWYGGGVSELLRSMVPLYRALGIRADWLVIPEDPRFFAVTKRFHNALQGAQFELTREMREVYLAYNEAIAAQMPRDYDLFIVHDPQPAALRYMLPDHKSKWVWRCHIDSSHPHTEVADFFAPMLAKYDALIYTMKQFVLPQAAAKPAFIIAPAIDPLSPKNLPIPQDLARQIVAWSGVHLERALITQVSRFDPWKDPLGVIEVYRAVRRQVPGVQLALVGQMALDDPEGWEIYHRIVAETRGDGNIHVLTNFTGIGNMEVNAFQSASNVVLQKSIREGFGLVVSESLWKGVPVVASRNAGGIPMQMHDGCGGFLVEGVSEFVDATVRLLKDPRLAQELGSSGRAHVRSKFLITRLLADELQVLRTIAEN